MVSDSGSATSGAAPTPPSRGPGSLSSVTPVPCFPRPPGPGLVRGGGGLRRRPSPYPTRISEAPGPTCLLGSSVASAACGSRGSKRRSGPVAPGRHPAPLGPPPSPRGLGASGPRGGPRSALPQKGRGPLSGRAGRGGARAPQVEAGSGGGEQRIQVGSGEGARRGLVLQPPSDIFDHGRAGRLCVTSAGSAAAV